ncbi:MAG: class I SAM-dependent methyltransferase [Dermatophilaceae bacterium]
MTEVPGRPAKADPPSGQKPYGDVDYEATGSDYGYRRRTDPRIATLVWEALGPAESVVNVGAGAGSYEPADRAVTAVEPSASMRAQRGAHLSPAVAATAEDLPFPDDTFDAAMAIVTVHQWTNWRRGVAEMCRVARGPVVILTFDPLEMSSWWLNDYVPELFVAEAARYPTIEQLRDALGGATRVVVVPIPLDCVDGFTEAFYGRPEAFLDPAVRAAQSAWQFADPAALTSGLSRLSHDLADGTWDAAYGHLRTQPEQVGAVRLVLGTPG